MFARRIIGISLTLTLAAGAPPAHAESTLQANPETTITTSTTTVVPVTQTSPPELLARPQQSEQTPSISAPPPHESLQLGRRLSNKKTTTDQPAAASDPSVVDTRTAFAFFIVLALIVALWAGLRRFAGSAGGLLGQLGPGGRAPSGLLTVLGRYPVARGQTLVLLKLDSRILLLSQSAQGFRTLSDITDAEEVASILTKARDEEGDSLASRFRSLLSKAERDPAIVTAEEIVVEPGPRAPWHESQPMQDEAGPNDPVSSIRRRLHSLRSPGE